MKIGGQRLRRGPRWGPQKREEFLMQDKRKKIRALRSVSKRRKDALARCKDELKKAKQRIAELESVTKSMNILQEKTEKGDFHAQVLTNQVGL